ncbi:hypothetical protein [Rubritalea tangerina]|uniref:hypothetical protein n=1 Tax=Rubritalea tangerina TaxID=430798 RepID=UPI0036088102
MRTYCLTYDRLNDIDPNRFRRFVVLLLALGISVLFLFVVKDFLMPLLLAGIFAGLLRPVYRRVRVALKGEMQRHR